MMSSLDKKKEEDSSAVVVASDLENAQTVTILLADIIPDPENPRTYFDPGEARELEKSISTENQKKHIEVLPKNAQGKYMLCDGERRYRALIESSAKYASVIIKDDLLDPIDRHLSATTSNLHQSPMIDHDLALALLKQKTERGLETNQQVADLVSMDVQKVGKLLRLAQMDQDVARCTRPDAPDHMFLSLDGALRICKEVEYDDQYKFHREASRVAEVRKSLKPQSRRGIPREVLVDQIALYTAKKEGEVKSPVATIAGQQQGIRSETQNLIRMIDSAIKFSNITDKVFEDCTPRMIADFYKKLSPSDRDALQNAIEQMSSIEFVSEALCEFISDNESQSLTGVLNKKQVAAMKNSFHVVALLAEVLQKK